MTLQKEKYNVAAGETFDSIANAVYGNEKYTPELMAANPELCHKYIFDGGETLYLPVIETEEYEGLPVVAPWKE